VSGPTDAREQALARARGYPYAAPRTSFVLAGGHAFELVRGSPDVRSAAAGLDLTGARAVEPGSGRGLELSELLADDLSPDALAARTPVLAYGANRTPEALERKRSHPDFPDAASVVVLRARLRDLDVVNSAHLSPYGSVGATLQRSEGTAVETCLILLTEGQLAALSQTEPNYTLEELRDVTLELEGGGRLDRVLAYVSRHGCLVLDEAEVALAAIAAHRRRFRALTQPEVLAAVAARSGHAGELDEFILANLEDPELAADRTRELRRDARPLDWPLAPRSGS
jgi:hypothetical protein